MYKFIFQYRVVNTMFMYFFFFKSLEDDITKASSVTSKMTTAAEVASAILPN